jgi:hypothetical protein
MGVDRVDVHISFPACGAQQSSSLVILLHEFCSQINHTPERMGARRSASTVRRRPLPPPPAEMADLDEWATAPPKCSTQRCRRLTSSSTS